MGRREYEQAVCHIIFLPGGTAMFLEDANMKSLVRAIFPREIRNWMRSPTRAATWLWHTARFKMGATEKLELAQDLVIYSHPLAYLSAKKAQILDQEQRAEMQQFIAHFSADMFLFDIGANFGIFSLACAKLGGRAVAIDPSPISTTMIATQAKLNHLEGSIQILEAAAGDTEGTIEMVSSGIFSDGYFRYDPTREKRELTRVPVVTLDGLSGRLGYPTHLKIDVEGYESAVLRGGRQLLRESSPLIFLELHNEMVRDAGGNVSLCVDELLKLEYRLYSIHGSPISVSEAVSSPIARILAMRG